MKRRALCIFLVAILLVSMFPASVFAAHDSTGKPLDLTGDVYLALYVGGSDFPGEPAEHAVSGYLNLNASFGSTGFGKFAESAQSILEPSILNTKPKTPTMPMCTLSVCTPAPAWTLLAMLLCI